MRLRTLVISAVLIVAHAAALTQIAHWMEGGGSGGPDRDGAQGDEVRAVADFPNAHDEAPEGWTGPKFRLSQSYPTRKPGPGAAPWRQIDFRTDALGYLRAVLDYSLQGNVAVDFAGQDNRVRKWYHAPWLHASDFSGREFIHGMTRERNSDAGQLAPTQQRKTQTWAVGMYNAPGGWVLGQVWKNRDNPLHNATVPFPEGTVAFKLLFTTATVAEVPQLKRTLEWEADIERSRGLEPRPKVRLLQIDVAVRDKRADPTTGWVFGTFVYNGDAPGATVWDRMVPVGAMWGNDPDRIADGGPLSETVINPEARPLVTHLGYKDRLNGPFDNKVSSCMSCHSTAEAPVDMSEPPTREIPRGEAPAELARYFRNIKAATPFTAGRISLDYSLQLQNGIAEWAQETQLRHPPPPDTLGADVRLFKATDEIRFAPARR
jgi:hypothetical protein